jgi:hypothetical protein
LGGYVDEQESAREKPALKRFRSPVGWLFGRDLIASLKGILVYYFFGEGVDPKDWMTPAVDERFVGSADASGEFWFDYIADTGDGQRPAYALSYLCLGDLWATDAPAADRDRRQLAHTTAPKDAQAATATRLPRGEFLFVGGDTSYHVGDYRTLLARFHAPFWWAAKDRENAGHPPPDTRPIFAIPGNHDYYDNIVGFNRQFRPALGDDVVLLGKHYKTRLDLPGFCRAQNASYVFLRLPFDWSFLGVDAQNGRIDIRQYAFFDKALRQHGRERLIIATPEPTTCFGRTADPDSKRTDLFRALGLALAFLKDGALEPGRARVDISGNYHHYERYWGATDGTAETAHYAHIVAGGGGAFLHPSDTDFKQLPRKAVYPPPADSRRDVMRPIVAPWRVLVGGRVWLPTILAWLAIAVLARQLVGVGAPTALSWAFSGGQLVLVGAFTALSVAHYRRHRRSALGQSRLAYSWLIVLALAWPVYYWWKLPPFSLPASAAGFLVSAATIGVLVYWKTQYDSFLLTQPHWRTTGWIDDSFQWVLTIVMLALGALAFAAYGNWPIVSLVVTALALALVIAVGVGLIAFSVAVGATQFRGAPRGAFAIVGVLHATLQLGAATMWALVPTWSTALALVLAPWVLWPIGVAAANTLRGGRAIATVAWPVGGGGALAAAWFLGRGQALTGWPFWLATAALGAFVGCAHFGWYLAVSLTWNAHNNEAGGAARVERYKQFVRFRVTRERLTGYVVAVDEPRADAAPVARLVDVFHVDAPVKS